jgi:hypothetical protein
MCRSRHTSPALQADAGLRPLNKPWAVVHAARVGRIIWSVVLGLTVISTGWLEYLAVRDAVARWPVYKTDFTVFYTASRVPLDMVYDSVRLTAAQAWAGVDGSMPRPFAYPPTFLFLLWPFGRIEPLPALLSWVTLGLAAYCIAAWKLIGRAWPLIVLSPAVMVAVLTGQVTFLLGAGLMAGIPLPSTFAGTQRQVPKAGPSQRYHAARGVSRDNALMSCDGGRGGIRTHGGLAPTAVFKTAPTFFRSFHVLTFPPLRDGKHWAFAYPPCPNITGRARPFPSLPWPRRGLMA